MTKGKEKIENKPLDIDFIQRHIFKAAKESDVAANADIVLMIGNTGVGKSTSGNYLIDHKMRQVKFNGKKVIETEEAPTFKIGHKVESETLYAKPVSCRDASFAWMLADCPGFLGNRTKEESVVESISVELTIRKARQVKGILIFISLNQLLETRLGEIRELMKTLTTLFKDPVEMINYSTIVITKLGNNPLEEAKEATIGAMESLKEHCSEQAEKLRSQVTLSAAEGLTAADYAKMADFFTAALNKKRIVYINPLDGGQSRKLIINSINGIKPRKHGMLARGKEMLSSASQMIGLKAADMVRPITIEDFQFSRYDANRMQFNKAIYDGVKDGIELLASIKNCENIVRHAKRTIKDSEFRILTLDKLIKELKNYNPDSDEKKLQKQRSVQIWEGYISKNQESINYKYEETETIGERIEVINGELQKIDNNKRLLYRKASINENVGFFSVFGWRELKFDASTGDSDIKFIKIIKSMENGKWHDEDDRRDEGIYKITYKSNFRARPAKASVEAFIETNKEPGNKTKIKALKKERTSKANEKTQLLADVAKLQSDNQQVQSDIDNAEAGLLSGKEQREIKLQESEKKKGYYILAKKENEPILEQAKIRGSNLLKDFGQEQEKLNALVNIEKHLEFPSSLLTDFVKSYQTFLKDLPRYITIFKGDDVSLIDDSMVDDETIACEKVLDPITNQKIKEPVITKDGTLFDEHSLLQQYADKTKPFVFKHKDGKKETIEYNTWRPAGKNIREILRDKYQQSAAGYSPQSPTFFKLRYKEMDIPTLEAKRIEVAQRSNELKKELDKLEVELDKIDREISGKRTVKMELDSSEQPSTSNEVRN